MCKNLISGISFSNFADVNFQILLRHSQSQLITNPEISIQIIMKKYLILAALTGISLLSYAKEVEIQSPDGKYRLTVNDNGGMLQYSLRYVIFCP